MISSLYPLHPPSVFLSFPKILHCIPSKRLDLILFEFHLHEQNECVLITLVVWTVTFSCNCAAAEDPSISPQSDLGRINPCCFLIWCVRAATWAQACAGVKP